MKTTALPAAFFTTAMLLLASSGSSAHETWLLPDDFSPATGSLIEFQMSSGMGFPAKGSAITPDRVVDASLANNSSIEALDPQRATQGGLSLQALAKEGLNCVWVQLRPRILEIPDHDDIEHYLEEIGAGDSVWQHWTAEKDEELWRESYSKLARTYLRASASGAATDCTATASRSRFDILPQQDPTQLSAGESLDLRVLFDGEPINDQSVAVVREGDQPQALLSSDEKGLLRVQTTGTGRYMVYATHLRAIDRDIFNWESDFVTLTFEVSD
ncbi:MAG: DUF4198 domain-containing protein [Myxococcota bacterium]